MAGQVIDFWFTMGSTYTYFTVMRIERAVEEAGISLRWRPFRNLAALTGATQGIFLEGTAKTRYMLRDIERRAGKYCLPVRLPVPYPVPNAQRANRVALIGMREGWGPAYVREAYRQWFEHGVPNGGDENLRASLAASGQSQDVDRILTLADSKAVDRDLQAVTDEARQLGIFGAPTFAIGAELFWGDDHLEDALQWARQGRLTTENSADLHPPPG